MSKHKKIEVLDSKITFQKKFFQVEEARLRHETPDGDMSEEIERLVMHRGDGVSAVVYDPKKKRIVLVRQFRYPTYTHTAADAWLVELPAGMVEKGETPAKTIRREIEEETGFQPSTLEPISTFYLSPGGSSEAIHLFYAEINLNKPVGRGGGLLAEQEHLEVFTVSRTKAAEMMRSGEIRDAKTLIGLQWLLHREGFLRQR